MTTKKKVFSIATWCPESVELNVTEKKIELARLENLSKIGDVHASKRL
jgi:hypothetical protein